MPTTNSRELTLTTTGTETTIDVAYNVVFTPFERFLASNGLKFWERISVNGVDGATLTVLRNFNPQPITVPAEGSLTVHRTRTLTVHRSTLQEDPTPGDDDEINCSITIDPEGLPVKITANTDTEILLG